MKIHYKKSDTFIPEWNDNKLLPEEEQVKFHHTFLSTEQRKKFVYWKNYTEGQMAVLSVLANTEKLSEDDSIKALERDDREYVQDAAGIAKTITTKIDNLTMIDENENEHKIDTIEKFYKAPDAFSALRAEYEQYCLTLSARADSKNLQPPSSVGAKGTTESPSQRGGGKPTGETGK